MTNNELLELLKKEVSDTQNYINEKENFTFKQYLMSLLVKSGIGLKYAFPFLVGACISIYVNHNYLNNTLGIDRLRVNSSKMTTMTSTGLVLEKKSYDNNYNDNTIKHSTGWNIDSNGLYVRIETTYDIENEERYMDLDVIKTMTKEYLDSIFNKSNIEVIKKKNLSQEDYIYNKEMLIFNYSYVDTEDYIYRDETARENFYNSLNIVFFAFVIDGITRLVISKSIDNKVTKKLEDLKIKYKILSSDEYSEMLRILNLKKDNLKLIEEDTKVKKIGGKYE